MVKVHGQATFMRFLYQMARRLSKGQGEAGFIKVLKSLLEGIGQELPKKYR